MAPFLSTLATSSARGLGRALKPFIQKPSITSPANNATNQSSSSLAFSSSAFQIVGKATPHTYSDWQIASNSGFSTIVKSLTNDTSNKTSWTVTSGLSLNTTYYVRVRYKDSTNLVSDWSNTITFTVEGYLPSLSNGTEDITVSAGSNYYWTVPSRIGRVKVQMYGGGAYYAQGGYMDVSFDVVPGERILFAKTPFRTHPTDWSIGNGVAVAFWGENGSTTISQANLWAIVGGGGGGARSDSGHVVGGAPGGGNEGSAGALNYYGDVPGGFSFITGGTQSSGGQEQPQSYINSVGGFGQPGWSPYMPNNQAGQPQFYWARQPHVNSVTQVPRRGTAIYGKGDVANGIAPGDGRDLRMSDGGDGWYGGCGAFTPIYVARYYEYPEGSPPSGVQHERTNVITTSASGGSSRIQIPAGRNPTTTTNQTGSAGGPSLSTGIKITY